MVKNNLLFILLFCCIPLPAQNNATMSKKEIAIKSLNVVYYVSKIVAPVGILLLSTMFRNNKERLQVGLKTNKAQPTVYKITSGLCVFLLIDTFMNGCQGLYKELQPFITYKK